MTKKEDEIQKLLNETQKEVNDLRAKIKNNYIKFMFWATGGLASGFFVILLAIAIRYFFTDTPPTS